MHMYMYMYMHMSVYVYVHVYVYLHVYMDVYTHMHVVFYSFSAAIVFVANSIDMHMRHRGYGGGRSHTRKIKKLRTGMEEAEATLEAITWLVLGGDPPARSRKVEQYYHHGTSQTAR